MAGLRADDHFRPNAVLPTLRTAWHGDCYYKNRRFLAYILLSGAVPGPTGAALLFSWLGWGRLGASRAALFLASSLFSVEWGGTACLPPAHTSVTPPEPHRSTSNPGLEISLFSLRENKWRSWRRAVLCMPLELN